MSGALPYNIETVPGYGRVLVAARDLAPWELVLEDTCLVMAPCDTPVCLACLGQVNSDMLRAVNPAIGDFVPRSLGLFTASKALITRPEHCFVQVNLFVPSVLLLKCFYVSNMSLSQQLVNPGGSGHMSPMLLATLL